MSATLNVDMVREWLGVVHGQSPGLIGISAAGATPGERFTNTAFETIDDAVRQVGWLDRAGKQGIYHRVTTLRERPPQGRRGNAEASLALPGLWADIDIAGPGHKTTEPLPPDFDSARKIVTASELPEPTRWIFSGGGCYPWWLLGEPHIIGDDLEQIQELSRQWQAALERGARRLGFHYGNVGDLPRVLRIPGTVNRKAGLSRPCFLLPEIGPSYTLDGLQEAVRATEPPPSPAASPAPVPAEQRTFWEQANRPHGAVGPFDAFDESGEIRDVLMPHDWTFGGYRDGGEVWNRAGGSSGLSAVWGRNGVRTLVVHSTEAGLPSGAGQRLTLGRVFAHLNFGGDESAAAKALLLAAAHDPVAAQAAVALPAHVLDHIAQRCGVRRWEPPPAPSTRHDEHDAPEPEPADDEDGDSGQAASSRRYPEEFWAARPVLGHIRQAAHARNRSGEVVLGGVLARVAAMLPPELKADTKIGSPACANMFVALVGPSGVGKSGGASIPRLLLPAPPLLDFMDDLPLGSGEGLAEAYMGEREEPTGEIYRSGPRKGDPKMATVRTQVRHNALFYADEGEALIKTLSRTGATIGESLRRAWVGGTIGQFNGKAVNTRVVAAGSYSLGVVVGFQPETALPLLEDDAAGTPQRFLWVSVIDPSIPQDAVEDPGRLELPLLNSRFGTKPAFIFAPEILAEIRRDDWERATGAATLPSLDAHKPLMKVKLAALLAVLANRLDVTAEDWQLAEVMWRTSAAVRDHVLEHGARQRAKETEARISLHVDREVRAHAAKQAVERDTERVARGVARKVKKGNGMTVGAVRKATAARDRDLLPSAIDYAESLGWVAVEGDRLIAGDSEPR